MSLFLFFEGRAEVNKSVQRGKKIQQGNGKKTKMSVSDYFWVEGIVISAV